MDFRGNYLVKISKLSTEEKKLPGIQPLHGTRIVNKQTTHLLAVEMNWK